jgi:TolB-like protein/cytochrome c-type biogenesis protein CcmH/NrfG
MAWDVNSNKRYRPEIMAEKGKYSIRIDLDQFKMHININDKTELSLHFDSPSRKFYLSVIALVVHEMQKLGRVTSVPLEEHYDALALLNQTVGGSAGSSKKKNVISRIYKKWKGALPDLENAPLFRVLGKTKEYGDAIGRTYNFSEEEKDLWANLFEYKGSEEKVRLRFSVDKLGASLDDVVITYKENLTQLGGTAWDGFLDTLKKERIAAQAQVQTLVEPSREHLGRMKWVTFAVVVALILLAGTLAIWNFFLRPPPIEPASVEKMAFPLPDKPSIAVLPFVNMSEDSKLEYFSDGITEEIITALSKSKWLFVIARNSTFTYKKKPVKVQQVAEELGVRYVLEGSVRKAGDRVRITAQFADAITGNHLWAERYDRELKDIFALQDEITIRVLSALRVKLTLGERARLGTKQTDNLEAYLKALEGHGYFLRGTPEGYRLARRLEKEAIALDPEFSGAYRVLAWTHLMEALIGTSKSPRKSIEQAHKLAEKALALDESSALNYGLRGLVYLYQRKPEKAVATLERAVDLDPNNARVHMYLGWSLVNEERLQEAIFLLEKAMRLNPLDQKFESMCRLHKGRAYNKMERYEEAIAELEKALQIRPTNWATLLALTSAYIGAGREEEGRVTARKLLKIQPKFSLEAWAKRAPHKNQASRERAIKRLRKAGLK